MSDMELDSELLREFVAEVSDQLTSVEVNKGIQNVASITEKNAASSEEMAASAKELSNQSDRLKELVSRFKI